MNSFKKIVGLTLGLALAFSMVTVGIVFSLGDADGDSEVSDWDSVILERYLAGWNVTIDLGELDIDGDGDVTDWDSILLSRYLAGWDIEYFRENNGYEETSSGPGDTVDYGDLH